MSVTWIWCNHAIKKGKKNTCKQRGLLHDSKQMLLQDHFKCQCIFNLTDINRRLISCSRSLVSRLTMSYCRCGGWKRKVNISSVSVVVRGRSSIVVENFMSIKGDMVERMRYSSGMGRKWADLKKEPEFSRGFFLKIVRIILSRITMAFFKWMAGAFPMPQYSKQILNEQEYCILCIRKRVVRLSECEISYLTSLACHFS